MTAPGTINIVAVVPEHLSRATMINAVATATEAKAQALWDCGIAATARVRTRCASSVPTMVRPILRRPAARWGSRLALALVYPVPWWRVVTRGES